MKTWQGRIAGGSDPLFEAFNSSVAQDQRLAPYDVRVSGAHARALAAADLISREEADTLVRALNEIGEEIATGAFTWRDDLEDVHTHVESRLREKVGDLADRLHTGRSRNDQVAADVRLLVKDLTRQVLAEILSLQRAFLDLANRYPDDLMPGYTHLQQAQPVVIAHVLLAYVSMLGRDWERFRDVLGRTDRSPLGAGALSGAGFPLDRHVLARETGFSVPIENSVDAVSDRDFLVEFIQAAALCMTHLSRFSEDLIIWSSTEFGFVRLPDAFASGSSMMPQKKNPDVPELIRGKTALVIGDAAAALTLVKGIPLSYNKDLQEDKTPLYHAADSLLASLGILAAMVPHLEFDTARTRSAISSYTLATDLADHLVRAGVPFREAHAIVGGLVQESLSRGVDLTDLNPSLLAEASPALASMPELTPEASVRRKGTAGSTHPDEVAAQVRAALLHVDERDIWLGGRT